MTESLKNCNVAISPGSLITVETETGRYEAMVVSPIGIQIKGDSECEVMFLDETKSGTPTDSNNSPYRG